MSHGLSLNIKTTKKNVCLSLDIETKPKKVSFSVSILRTLKKVSVSVSILRPLKKSLGLSLNNETMIPKIWVSVSRLPT